MGRDRSLLHKTQLDEYAEFAKRQGWKAEAKPYPAYQVLRMRLGKRILIVYERINAREHFTLYGEALSMGHRFYQAKRRAKATASASQRHADQT